MIDVAQRIDHVSDPTRRQFITAIQTVARRYEARFETARRELMTRAR
jgi:hypothetical protein